MYVSATLLAVCSSLVILLCCKTHYVYICAISAVFTSKYFASLI